VPCRFLFRWAGRPRGDSPGDASAYERAGDTATGDRRVDRAGSLTRTPIIHGDVRATSPGTPPPRAEQLGLITEALTAGISRRRPRSRIDRHDAGSRCAARRPAVRLLLGGREYWERKGRTRLGRDLAQRAQWPPMVVGLILSGGLRALRRPPGPRHAPTGAACGSSPAPQARRGNASRTKLNPTLWLLGGGGRPSLARPSFSRREFRADPASKLPAATVSRARNDEKKPRSIPRNRRLVSAAGIGALTHPSCTTPLGGDTTVAKFFNQVGSRVHSSEADFSIAEEHAAGAADFALPAPDNVGRCLSAWAQRSTAPSTNLVFKPQRVQAAGPTTSSRACWTRVFHSRGSGT